MATNRLGFTPAQELARKNEDLSSEIRGIFIALIPLSVVAVLLRFVSRRLARARLWWDDWLTVVALVSHCFQAGFGWGTDEAARYSQLDSMSSSSSVSRTALANISSLPAASLLLRTVEKYSTSSSHTYIRSFLNATATNLDFTHRS